MTSFSVNFLKLMVALKSYVHVLIHGTQESDAMWKETSYSTVSHSLNALN